MSVRYFSYEEGLEKDICDLLNVKIEHVTSDFDRMIDTVHKEIKHLNEVIAKYKRLAPKSKNNTL